MKHDPWTIQKFLLLTTTRITPKTPITPKKNPKKAQSQYTPALTAKWESPRSEQNKMTNRKTKELAISTSTIASCNLCETNSRRQRSGKDQYLENTNSTIAAQHGAMTTHTHTCTVLEDCAQAQEERRIRMTHSLRNNNNNNAPGPTHNWRPTNGRKACFAANAVKIDTKIDRWIDRY